MFTPRWLVYGYDRYDMIWYDMVLWCMMMVCWWYDDCIMIVSWWYAGGMMIFCLLIAKKEMPGSAKVLPKAHHPLPPHRCSDGLDFVLSQPTHATVQVLTVQEALPQSAAAPKYGKDRGRILYDFRHGEWRQEITSFDPSWSSWKFRNLWKHPALSTEVILYTDLHLNRQW